jgi:glyoxylase-like metal-dependent hydrolase (beta-lactamase superfamily II)
MKIQHFYDQETATFTYIVIDEKTQKCAIIDSVLDFDITSGRASTKQANLIIDYVKTQNLQLEWILETHIHADHLSASQYLKEKLGGKIAIGEKITEVIKFWTPIFNSSQDTKITQFDKLFNDNEKFFIGTIEVKVIHTPGHTQACATYLIEDCAFVGDVIFTPQNGTGRTDFPGGSAKDSYDSIQKLLKLPDETRIFVGHDYPDKDQQPQHFCTVLEQKKSNILINEKISEEHYILERNQRDIGKKVPKLLLPALQFNMRAGSFGEPENNSTFYIKIPINKI